jgi:RNA:NAD 2'-phosphotransferase (TPT1/KptA family)
MIKEMYHATDYNNLEGILTQGIYTGIDGIVYLADSPDNAAKFVAVRLIKHIIVLKVRVPEETMIETFDHSESFFRCKSYGCTRNITIDEIAFDESYEYNL